MAGSPPNPPPPTFPVHPSDGELIVSYLRPRVVSDTRAGFIHEADLYSADPDLLTSDRAAATSSSGETAWYFFTRLFAKGPNRMKRNVFIARGAPGREGSWVSAGDLHNVLSNNGERIGERRGFEFKEKVGRNFVKSAWRMMELRLPNEGVQKAYSPGPLVLSKVYRLPTATAADESSMTVAEWRMTELRLNPNPNPNEGGQEAGSSDLLALCKVCRSLSSRIAKAEGGSSTAVAEAAGEAPAASAVVMPEPKGADEEIGAKTAAGPGRKRKADDKDSCAETVASSPVRQKKADGKIESADADTTTSGQIFADGKGPVDAAEQEEQEEPRDPRDRQFHRC